MSSGDCRLLSVVVIGRNEGERLERCLLSVNNMERSAWEVELIYVDSASTDGSVALAAALGAEVVELHPERPTAALARNAGWRKAGGDFVLFLDGDTILHPGFVGKGLPEFANQSIAIVWGHRREIQPEASVYNRVLDLDWIYRPGWTSFCGGDAIFRRSALTASSGFDETLIAGEEPELCRRLTGSGWLILHVDQAMTAHDLGVLRFRQYWQRAARAGHAFAEVSERFRGSPHPFWTPEATRNRTHAAALLGVGCVALAGAAVGQSVLPVFLLAGCSLALATRSAWKARWKSADWVTLLLYGVHSHLQQLPIFVGQLRYWRNRRSGFRSALVEYKQR